MEKIFKPRKQYEVSGINPVSTNALVNGIIWVFAVALISLATVWRGGNRYMPLMLLEGLAAVLVLGLAWRTMKADVRGSLGEGWGRVALIALLGAPFWIALFQLTPLPETVWLALPGRAEYLTLPTDGQPSTMWRVASLTPDATWGAVFAGLPLVACFALALSATPPQLGTLYRLWLGVALAQAILGLMQLGPFPGLYFGLSSKELVGSFASKNTYSNFLVMAMPLVIWELSGKGERESGQRRSTWLWGSAFFVLLATLLATMSRTGIVTGLLVTMLAAALLPARETRRWAGLPWGFWSMALLIVLALAAGGLTWLDRFESNLLFTDDATRALMRDGTWRGALAFWPVGAGLGSYATVFPRFQAAELGYHLIDLAHSDYLQLLMDLGALGLALIAALLALLLRRVVQLAQIGRRRWEGRDTLAVAAGLGSLAFGLHAWVDYPMRIPANAMFAAFLIGVFLRPSPNNRAEGTT